MVKAKVKKYKKEYIVQYRDNSTGELMEYSFTARNDDHAYRIAVEYCDTHWHKYYGTLRVK